MSRFFFILYCGFVIIFFLQNITNVHLLRALTFLFDLAHTISYVLLRNPQGYRLRNILFM